MSTWLAVEDHGGMSDDLEKRIGASIATAREKANLSQAELAERISLHETSLSNIERGAKLPTIRTLLLLADALERQVQDFLPTDRTPTLPVKRLKREAEVRELVRDMSDKKLDVAYDILAALSRLK